MTHPSKLPIGSPEDLQRVIDLVCAVYEKELGDNLGAWGAVTMVLLNIICEMSGADIHDVAAALTKTEYRRMQ